MAGLPTLLSNAFRLPTSGRQEPAVGQQQQPVQGMGMGSPAEGLQAIEGITQDYYTKYGEAQSFAQEMNQVGIDVTNPDNRNQEERDAANLYRKMIADVRFKGEELKNSQKMLEKFASAKLSSFGADIQNENDPNAIFDINKVTHTGMTSAEKDAAISARQEQQIEAIGGRQEQMIDATASNTDKRINATALQGSLNRAVQVHIANIRDKRGQNAVEKQVAPYQPLYEAATNLITGNVDWKPSTRTNIDGKQMLQAPFWGGSSYGTYEDVQERKNAKGDVTSTSVRTRPRIVKGGLLDPDTGEVFIEFKHGGMEKVDQSSVGGMIAKYAESNKGYKAADAQVFVGMLEEMEEMPTPEIGQGMRDYNQAVFDESQKDLKKLKSINRSGSAPEFKLDDGTVIEMHRESRSWTGVGTSDIRIKGAEDWGIQPDQRFTEEQAIEALHEMGYYTGKKFAPTKGEAPAEEAVVFDPTKL